MPNEQATANIVTQIGPEGTAFTAVAATRILGGIVFPDEPKLDSTQHVPQGRLYIAQSVAGKEWSEFKPAGYPDFNGLPYPFSSMWGAATITTPTNGLNSRQWQWKPTLINGTLGQTYTIERGSTLVRARRYAGCFFDALGLQFVKDAVSYSSGHGFGQALQDAFTLTPALTPTLPIPLTGVGTSVYLDTVSANIGTTQIKKVGQNTIDWSNYYAPAFFVDQSQPSYSTAVADVPQVLFKVKAVADSNGMALYPYIKSGQTVYLRYIVTGPVIENEYTLSLGGPSAGTFTLTYNGVTTAGIAFNAIGSVVQTALTGLSSVGANNATVSGGAGGPYTIYLLGPLTTSPLLLTGSGAGLTGGSFSLTNNLINAKLTIDAAVKVTAPAPYSDDQKLEVMEFSLKAAEDPAWNTGQSMLITVVNMVAAL